MLVCTDMLGALVQTLSFRDAYYSEIMSAQPGFEPETFLCGSVNPNPLGHR